MIKEPIHFYTKGFIKKPVRHYYIMTLSHWAFNTRLALQYWGGGHKTHALEIYKIQNQSWLALIAAVSL